VVYRERLHNPVDDPLQMTALQDVIGADDRLVVATLVHLLRSGWLTWGGQARVPRGLSRRVN